GAGSRYPRKPQVPEPARPDAGAAKPDKPDGEIVAVPEEEHVEDVTMASDDREPEPAGEAREMQAEDAEPWWARLRRMLVVPVWDAAGAPLPATLVAAPAVPPADTGCGEHYPAVAESRSARWPALRAATVEGAKARGLSGTGTTEEERVRFQQEGFALIAATAGRSRVVVSTGVAQDLKVEGRGKRGTLVPISHAVLVAGLKKLAEQQLRRTSGSPETPDGMIISGPSDLKMSLAKYASPYPGAEFSEVCGKRPRPGHGEGNSSDEIAAAHVSGDPETLHSSTSSFTQELPALLDDLHDSTRQLHNRVFRLRTEYETRMQLICTEIFTLKHWLCEIFSGLAENSGISLGIHSQPPGPPTLGP
ncbi:hypothetical protein CYMTET_17967, partial [Cymbomonas tetramitiformis]